MGLIEQLKAGGFTFNKNLGQNFIVDHGFLQSIVGELALSANDIIIEIGTGAGTFTKVLAQNTKKVITFEIDKRLEKILASQFESFKNIQLIFADALKADEKQINEIAGGPFSVVANIPYYITTPLLMKFIAISSCMRICVLVQDDVARRIIAKPGSKDYGALSVTLQAQADCKIIKYVPRKLFVPEPNVDSAFVVINKKSHQIKNAEVFEKMLKGMFAARRKTVLNGLSIAFNADKETARKALAEAQIKETARAEEITVDQFVSLSNILERCLN